MVKVVAIIWSILCIGYVMFEIIMIVREDKEERRKRNEVDKK